MTRTHPGKFVWLAALLVAAVVSLTAVRAQERVLIYRCTDAKGALTIQNDKPCPKGSKQERRVLETATSAAAPAARAPEPPASPTPAQATAPLLQPAPAPALPSPPPAVSDEPAIADEDRLPPPVLFECRTYDGDRYLNDDGSPPQRCVVLTTTGLGGIPAGGAGQACEMKADECQRVPDGALCDSWRQRLREAEAALRFGTAEDRPFAEAEVARIDRIVRESVCNQ